MKKSAPTKKKNSKFVRYTAEEAHKLSVSYNAAKVAATTDEAIDRAIASDPDTAPLLHTLPESWRIAPLAIRRKLGLTQDGISRMLHISLGTWRNWEQGRSEPYGPAAALLRVLQKNPKSVMQALRD